MLPQSYGCTWKTSRTWNAVAILGMASLFVMAGCGSGVKFATQAASGGTTQAVSAVPSGPQLGYAWYAQDETLRPILGVAGSSQFGESVVPAGAYVAGASSSPAGVALLISSDHQVYKMALPNGVPAQIGAAAGAGSVIRFSPTGATALLFVPGGTSAMVVTGISGTPQVKQLTAGSAILDVAVSDAGSVAAVLQAGHGATVNLLSGGGHAIATLSGAGGVSFTGASEDLLVADSGANTLTLVKSASTTATPVQIPTANLLKAPVALGASLSGKYAAVANSGDSSVIRVDLTGASVAQRVVCPVQPTLVAQLSGNGVFRFNEINGAPVWVSDVTAASPSMLFIPALASATGTTKTGSSAAQ